MKREKNLAVCKMGCTLLFYTNFTLKDFWKPKKIISYIHFTEKIVLKMLLSYNHDYLRIRPELYPLESGSAELSWGEVSFIQLESSAKLIRHSISNHVYLLITNILVPKTNI